MSTFKECVCYNTSLTWATSLADKYRTNQIVDTGSEHRGLNQNGLRWIVVLITYHKWEFSYFRILW